MAAPLDLAALTDTATGKKQPLHSHISLALGISIGRCLIVEGIDLSGYVLSRPRPAPIGAVIPAGMLCLGQVEAVIVATPVARRAGHPHI